MKVFIKERKDKIMSKKAILVVSFEQVIMKQERLQLKQ